MIGILFENDEARSSLLQSCQTQSRIEQQRRDQRDVSWETTVARLHNDVSFTVVMNYAGMVDDDDKQTLQVRMLRYRRRGVVLG